MANADPTREIAEQWRPVVGYEGLYEVSNLGKVCSVDRTVNRCGKSMRLRGKELRPGMSKGYLRVNLTRNGEGPITFRIHRLVLSTFLREPLPGEVANHKDSNRSNNSILNLEWVTPKENTAHCIRNIIAACVRGEDSPASKLSESDVREIRRLCASGNTQKDVAVRFRVHSSHVCRIVHRKWWQHVA